MKSKFKTFFKKSKLRAIASASIVCVLIIAIVLVFVFNNGSSSEEVTYRETTVKYGSLTVGVTESGSVDIGTIQQTFDLDMSALLKVSTSNTSSSSSSGSSSSGNSGMGGMSAGGNSGMGGGFSMGGSTDSFSMFSAGSSTSQTSSSSNSKLVASEVCVSVGQTVKVGDVLYRLEEEGVNELTEELKTNVDKAEADLNALIADQEISKLTAKYNYDSAIAYGDYASTEKSYAIKDLEDAISTYEKNLSDAKELVTLYTQRLSQANIDLDAANQNLNNLIFMRDSIDKSNDVYMYAYYSLEVSTAEKTVSSAEQSVEQYENKLEQAKNNVSNYEIQLSKAKRQLESGKLSATETYDLRVLSSENAQESYDITIAYLEDDLKEQQEIYDDTKEKWDTFVSYIDGVEIKSNYNGVITSVDLEEGDVLSTNTTVVTLYDTDDVSMTVTLSDDDMTDIELGTEANVSLIAYPDTVFKATVSDIGDASTDSSGNTTRDVTITFTSDVTGLYQGMTGEITFITKDVEEVLYVSNRAIIRKGTKSYVKIKDEKDNIKTVEVVTGFSDGVNVEIKEGLSEGDVVLVESKVTK